METCEKEISTPLTDCIAETKASLLEIQSSKSYPYKPQPVAWYIAALLLNYQSVALMATDETDPAWTAPVVDMGPLELYLQFDSENTHI